MGLTPLRTWFFLAFKPLFLSIKSIFKNPSVLVIFLVSLFFVSGDLTTDDVFLKASCLELPGHGLDKIMPTIIY